MQKLFLTIILLTTHPVLCAFQSHTTHEQHGASSTGVPHLDDHLLYQDAFDEHVENLVIPPTDNRFSFKKIGLYLKLAYAYLVHERIKPAYYAVIGYLKGSKK